jgi:hypothetical protein
LAGTLCPLIVIKVALDPVDAAVEYAHERPQERMQVGLQTRVGERRDQRVEHVGECALQLHWLRQRTRIAVPELHRLLVGMLVVVVPWALPQAPSLAAAQVAGSGGPPE